MRRVPVPSLPGAEPVRLDEGAAHKVRAVLRMGVGARLVVFDGRGGEIDAVVSRVDEVGCEVSAVGVAREATPAAPLHLVFGLPKGSALENVLRMAVECGVTHLHPVVTQRTVKTGERPDRWGRVLEGACAQCGRADRVALSGLATLGDAVASLPPGLDRRVGVPGAAGADVSAGGGVLCVGPEGGLTPREHDVLFAAGFQALGLGPWVLRVDTAVAVGLSRWTARAEAQVGSASGE